MNSILWHQDPPFVAEYMNFYLDKTRRILGVGDSHTHIKVLGATSGPIPLKIGDRWFIITGDEEIDITQDIDTGTVAPGADYNVYACDDGGVLRFMVSANSTYPDGFTADTSRKIGGFHTLNLAVGTIPGHPLSDYDTGDVLPQSVWCLKHRAKNMNNAGLVYDPQTQLWVQIYLASQSQNGGVQSVNGATILDTIDWNSFVDSGGISGMRLLTDAEFQLVARGTNEATNIAGSSDPVTTTGHVDTSNRRMVSDIGLEDTSGVVWQWLQDQSSRFDMSAQYLGVTSSGAAVTVYHSASPGGGPVYLKFGENGNPYFCSNLTGGVDKWVTLGTNQKIMIKHDPTPENGGLAVYMDHSASEPNKLLINNTVHGQNVYIETNYNAMVVQLVHNVNASTTGVSMHYNSDNNRLEATFSNSANNSFNSAYFSPTFNWYSLPTNKGKMYKQGDFGDVKLVAGGAWLNSSYAGSRGRSASHFRWSAYAIIGGRFACESV